MQTAVWIDGTVTTAAEAAIPADDHGVLVGDGVFETLLVVEAPHRAAFAVSRHLRRLRRSCAALGIELTLTDDQVRAAVDACLAAAPDAGVVRITVTSGRGPLGSARGTEAARLVVVAGGSGRPSYESGTGVIVFDHPRHEQGVMAGVKSTSYAENVIALRKAHVNGASEALFADSRGRLSEGTGSNVFWVDGDRIHTPPLHTGCLAGITRELVMEHFDVVESELAALQLCQVSEAFLTSTTRVVQSIGAVDGTALAVVDGPSTQQARRTMLELMATSADP